MGPFLLRLIPSEMLLEHGPTFRVQGLGFTVHGQGDLVSMHRPYKPCNIRSVNLLT